MAKVDISVMTVKSPTASKIEDSFVAVKIGILQWRGIEKDTRTHTNDWEISVGSKYETPSPEK